MNDRARLDHFFSVLREKRKAFADNYAFFAPKLAPRFNSFKFIRPDEIKLSKILAMLLNPQGDHAQGNLFLKLFFSEIDINYPNDTSNIKVGCEVSTDKLDNKSRRIDIVVAFDDRFGLAIENKPWAIDQFQQLSDYAKQMQNKFGKNWCLIYLSGSDSSPNEYSATRAQLEAWEENNQYKKINFGQIVDWLKKCEEQCQADHVRHFLRDFIDYCKYRFLRETNMVDANLIKDFALKAENLELALVIGQQMTTIKEELLKKFVTDLEAQLKVARPNWEFKPHINFSYRSSKWKTIRFCNPEWKNHSLGIFFDKDECVQLIWGICKNDLSTPYFHEDTLKKLNDSLNISGKISKWWQWRSSFPSPYHDWSRSIEPWLAIQSGEMAKIIVEKIEELELVSKTIVDEEERQIQLKNATTPRGTEFATPSGFGAILNKYGEKS